MTYVICVHNVMTAASFMNQLWERRSKVLTSEEKKYMDIHNYCDDVRGSVAAVDRLEEVTDGQLTGIDLWRSRSRLEIAVTSPYGHDHGQAV